MDDKKRKIVTTVEGFAEWIADNIDFEDLSSNEFDFDFTIAFYYDGIKYKELLEKTDGGWYGIHTLDCGFDSDSVIIVADYYGGGAYSSTEIDTWCSKDEAKSNILNALLHTLCREENVTLDTVLLVTTDMEI